MSCFVVDHLINFTSIVYYFKKILSNVFCPFSKIFFTFFVNFL